MGLTLAEYAEGKGLKLESLKSYGLVDHRLGVMMPYHDKAGNVIATRFRVGLDGGKRFTWKRGTTPRLYGLDRLNLAQAAGYVILVEGESDCHTLWQHSFPAVGVPGVDTWNAERDSADLAGVGRVVVIQEPGAGGDTLVHHLKESPIAQHVSVVGMADALLEVGVGVGDVNELYRAQPQRFVNNLTKLLTAAKPLLPTTAGLQPRMEIDFAAPTEPPDWLVDGLIERGTITILSGDAAAGKSILCQALVVALIMREPWLGRAVFPLASSAVVIDEENFTRVVERRLRALGMTNANRERLHYFCRIGASLGRGDWGHRAEETLRETGADLIVIDSASSACSVDVNDNSAVAQFFKDTLRPLTRISTVVLIHHERKPSLGYKRNAGHEMMGARQWAGQSDAHLAVKATGEVEEEAADEKVLKRYPLYAEMPKSRDGLVVHETLVIKSENDADERLTKMWVESEIAAQRGEFVARIIATLTKGPMRRKDLAAALDCRDDDGGMSRALRRLQADGHIHSPSRGFWALTDPSGQLEMPGDGAQ